MFLYFVTILSLISLAVSEFDEEVNSKYKTLPRDEFIEYFNSKQLSFKITRYLEGKVKPQNTVSSHFDDRSAANILPEIYDGISKDVPTTKKFDKLSEAVDAEIFT